MLYSFCFNVVSKVPFPFAELSDKSWKDCSSPLSIVTSNFGTHSTQAQSQTFQLKAGYEGFVAEAEFSGFFLFSLKSFLHGIVGMATYWKEKQMLDQGKAQEKIKPVSYVAKLLYSK